MTFTTHHREQDHRGTEDCSTVRIERNIGRYLAGTNVCVIIGDLIRRATDVRTHTQLGFHVVRLDAFIAPYDPQGSLSGVLSLNSFISGAGSDSFSLNAVLGEPVLDEKLAGFFMESWFVELYNDAITVLTQAVVTSDTVIYVDSSAGFPSVPFLIQIGTETMTVVAVNGNEWTVVRDNPQSHPAGSYVVVC